MKKSRCSGAILAIFVLFLWAGPLKAQAPSLKRVFIGGTVQGTNPSLQIVLGTNEAAAGADKVIRGATSLYPDRVYQLALSASGVTGGAINLVPPMGYRVLIDGEEKKQIDLTSVPDTDLYNVEIRRAGGSSVPGTPTPVAIGANFAWGVALGRLYNSALAGSLVIRSKALDTELFDRGVLSSVGVSGQVFVLNDVGGKLRQIVAPEVFVDVQDVTDGFRIDFYPLSAMGSPSPGGLRSITNPSAKYVSYEVKRGPQGVGLTIARTAGSVTTTTAVEQSGGSWMKSLAGDLVVEDRTNTTAANGDRVETLILKNGEGSIAYKTRRTYRVFPWNQEPDYPQPDELIEETEDPDGNPSTTQYSYYVDDSQQGSFAQIKSVTYPGGNWVKYEYYEDSARSGLLKYEYRPWQDAPVGPDSATAINCRFVEYDYTLDWDGVKTILSNREEKVLGVTVGKYTASATVKQNVNNLKLWTHEKTSYSDSESYLTTVIKAYQPDQEEAGSVYNGLLYSITNPDQTRTCYVHQRGTYDGTKFNVGADGKDMQEIALQGSAKEGVGTRYISLENTTIDEIGLISGRSTKTVTIRQKGRTVRTDVYVFNGTDFNMLGSTTYAYTDSGRLTEKKSSTGTTYSATWVNEFKTAEKTETGTEFLYDPDLMQRVKSVTKLGVAASAPFEAQPAMGTVYTYDAANHIINTETSGGGVSIFDSAEYDLAGRLTAQTGANGATTTYEYDLTNRKVTAVLPTTGRRIVTSHRDGAVESITGTAQTPEFYTFSYDEDGVLTAKQSQNSLTSGAWSETKTDWLGRTLTSTVPGSGATEKIQQTYLYNAVGQLRKTTQTGVNPTLYVYDDLGALSLYGLDVGTTPTDQLVLASMDQITKVEQAFVKDKPDETGHWWLRQRTYTYPKDNDATAVLLGESNTRVTGFTGAIVSEQRASDFRGNTTIQTTVVDRSNARVTETVDVPGSTTDAEQIYYNGLLVRSRDVQGQTVTYGYDGVGRSNKVVDPRKGAVETKYELNRNLVSEVRYSDTPVLVLAKYQYDVAARLIRTEDGLGNFVRNSYDNCGCGRLWRQWGSGTAPIEYTYDDFGRLTHQLTFRSGTGWDSDTPTPPTAAFAGTADTTVFDYYGDTAFLESRTDPAKSLSEPATKKIGYSYDAAGRLKTLTRARLYNENSLTATYAYLPATGLSSGVTFSDDTPDESYTYTRNGQPKTISDATGMRTLVYDTDKGMALTDEVLPDFFGTGRRLRYGYDLTTSATVQGRVTGYSLGTVSGTTFTAEQDTGYRYTANGRLNGIDVDPAGQTERHFTYGYHANQPSLVTTLEESTTGYSVARTYASRWDMVESISTKFGTVEKAGHAYTFNNLGQRKTALQSGKAFDDYGYPTYYRYDYNGRGELKTAKAYMGTTETDVTQESSPLGGRQYAYEYDAIGNRTSVNRTGVPADKETFTANSRNQIESKENKTVHVSGTSVSHDDRKVGVSAPSAAATRYQGHFWSAEVGIRPVNTSGPAKGTIKITAGQKNAGAGGKDLLAMADRTVFMPAATETLVYDDDGNLTQDGQWNYAYDAKNRLVLMETRSDPIANIIAILSGVAGGEQPKSLKFQYDYLDRRVSKEVSSRTGTTWTTVSKSRYIYQGWNVIAELDVNVSTDVITVKRQFFWGLDVTGTLTGAGGTGALLMIQDGSQTYLPAYDGNGNVTALMQANGTIAAAYEYSPFGEPLRSEGAYAADNPIRWATKWTDDETGLVYYGRRFYNVRQGRFMGRDPKEEAGGLNMYGFVGNDPVNSWDYLGMCRAGERAIMFRGRSICRPISNGSDEEESPVDDGYGGGYDPSTYGVYENGTFVGTVDFGSDGYNLYTHAQSFLNFMAGGASHEEKKAAIEYEREMGYDVEATETLTTNGTQWTVSSVHVINKTSELGTYLVRQDPTTGKWLPPVPSNGVTTKNAYINGILGSLARHAALGALHMLKGVTEFTLVNIPSRGFLGDILRVAGDKLGFTSDAAKFVAATIASVQNSGRDVTWIAHSGGGAAFAEGMRYARDNLGMASLDHNSVTFAAGANNAWATNAIAQSVGVRSSYYYSSWDAVPNIVGSNGNPLQMVASLLAAPMLFTGWSQHTAPSTFWGWQSR